MFDCPDFPIATAFPAATASPLSPPPSRASGRSRRDRETAHLAHARDRHREDNDRVSGRLETLPPPLQCELQPCVCEVALPNARKFLYELVASQIERSESEFAVESLCNIAKQCADILRYDFEKECLDTSSTVAFRNYRLCRRLRHGTPALALHGRVVRHSATGVSDELSSRTTGPSATPAA